MDFLSNLAILDYKISESIVQFRSIFLNNFFLTVTKLGVWWAILFFFICVSVFFYFYKKVTLILPLALILIGSGLTVIVIKFLVGRARPGLDLALYAEKLPSFPSAHAALILALFGFIIFCFWQFSLSVKIKIILSVLFISIIILVGFSRIYLNVHYTSDVLAGYLIGLVWLLMTIHFI